MIVYKVTNVKNGKVYIGKSHSKTPYRRWRLHVLEAGRGSKRYFCNAIRKYGTDAFTIEVIYQAKTAYELSRMETFFIVLHQSYVPANGYNMTMGGDGRKQSSEERRMRSVRSPRWMLGKHHPEETREKLSRAVSKAITGENNPFFGKHHSEETREKLSAQRRGVVPNAQALAAKAIHGTVWMYNPSTLVAQHVKPENISQFVADGWLNGRGSKASEAAKRRGVSAEHIRHMVNCRLAKRNKNGKQ